MATTTIKTKKDEQDHILLLMTVPREGGGLDVDIYLGNENYEPVGQPSLGFDPRTEEEYHKELRKQAHERNELIVEASTNPEWNPGYVAPEETEQDFYPDAAV